MDKVLDRVAAMQKVAEKSGWRVPDEMVDRLIGCGFFSAPASKRYHGAYEGGLFEHSILVAEWLIALTERNALKWTRRQSPFIVGMFHDLCKCDQYIDTDHGYVWNEEQEIKGHGDKSAILLARMMTLTFEEELCIEQHMGAFVDQEKWKDYTNAVKAYETVLWTHTADMIASQVCGV